MSKRNQIFVATTLFAGLTGTIVSSAAIAAILGHAPSVSANQEATTVAKRGKDDPAGDDRGTHGAGHPKSEQVFELARRGADDATGAVRQEDRRADRTQA